MTNTVTLSIGQTYHLKQGKDRIIYAGMPSDTVYSIAQRKASGYQGYAWNLFYPKRKQELIIDGVAVFVEDVSPEEIRLRVE